jgi:hypothetical protein
VQESFDGERNRCPPTVKDIETAIVESGGVSRFQLLSFLIIIMGMVCGAFFLYSLPYFEK